MPEEDYIMEERGATHIAMMLMGYLMANAFLPLLTCPISNISLY